MEDDLDYFARRASEERAAAERATDAWVRDVHRRLAEAYERRAGEAMAIPASAGGRAPPPAEGPRPTG